MLFAFWVLMAVWAWRDTRRCPRRDRLASCAVLVIAFAATLWQSVHPPLPSLSHAVVAATRAVIHFVR